MREYEKKYYRNLWITTILEIQTWCKSNGSYPRSNSNDPYEKFLGTRLRDLRIRLNKKFGNKSLDEIEDLNYREIVSIMRELDVQYYGKNKPTGRPPKEKKAEKKQIKNISKDAPTLYGKNALTDAYKLKNWVIANNKIPVNRSNNNEEKEMYDIMKRLAHMSRYIMIESLAGDLVKDPLYDEISGIIFNLRNIVELSKKDSEQRKLIAKRDAARDLCNSAERTLNNKTK